MTIICYAKRVYLSPLSEKKGIIMENKGSAGVYALICRVSNKFYVGGSINLTNRLLDYMQPAYLAQQTNRPILRAIVKYGLIHFIFVILETCHVTDTLQREQYWLDLLKPEYNLSPTAASTLGITLTEETKAKLRFARLGKTHSLETRLHMSETRRGPNNSWFGKSHTEETKPRISTALKGPNGPLSGIPRPVEVISLMRKNHPHTKAIFQYASDQITLCLVKLFLKKLELNKLPGFFALRTGNCAWNLNSKLTFGAVHRCPQYTCF
jgi:group I intron endonuclease